MRVHNFSAGPAAIPLEILEQAQAELCDWQGSGMSVLEVSHRGKDFVACAAHAEELMRQVLGVPDNYRVLFLQGGATGQFAAVPMNLSDPGEVAAFLNTGQWSGKAIKAALAQGVEVQVVADEDASNYTTVPTPGSFTIDPGTRYLHYTPNETIGGVEFGYVPDPGDTVPLVADFSSSLLSEPLEVNRFGLIYAGAQKNMGPAGLTLVIVCDDLLGHARPETPDIFNYAKMAASDSMLNTPPTFGIYLLGLTLEWIIARGGLEAMAVRNRVKADLLYSAIDSSRLYHNPVAPDARSRMNVVFTLSDPDQGPGSGSGPGPDPDQELTDAFVAGAAEAGLVNLKGHRSVGGIRASLYNALELEDVEVLVTFMAEFEAAHC
ncbi:MAG: 3-phosphoserine/phosphohydroxythreonine transaminase [Coriobacteriia bacterium]|nr:3-phosphoserine/phosphohydroxythreonine transaminase [Coriobacteriia bacterium]